MASNITTSQTTTLSNSSTNSTASTMASASSVLPAATSFTGFSSTFTTPTHSASSTTTTGGNGGGSGNENRDPSTSATLYLYTFLATLVLLLSISAAIILRSLYLRRRHQRMVEEAIRNGTWVPPSPGGSNPFSFGNNGRRIDLSKKPALWEAFVGSGELHTQRTGKAEAVTEWEWDSIRPFAAAYVAPPNQNDPESVESSAMPQERAPLTARLHRLMRNRQQSIFPIPSRMRPPATPTPVSAAPLLSNTPPPPAAPAVPEPPQKVRVAVLIAMPQSPEAKSRSPSPQLVASTSAVATPPHSSAYEETELPHIEFGVAELDVSSHKSNRNKEIRSSVASGSSVV